MDNTECIDGLSKLVHLSLSGQQKHLEVIVLLLTISFFFQLDATLIYYSGLL